MRTPRFFIRGLEGLPRIIGLSLKNNKNGTVEFSQHDYDNENLFVLAAQETMIDNEEFCYRLSNYSDQTDELTAGTILMINPSDPAEPDIGTDPKDTLEGYTSTDGIIKCVYAYDDGDTGLSSTPTECLDYLESILLSGKMNDTYGVQYRESISDMQLDCSDNGEYCYYLVINSHDFEKDDISYFHHVYSYIGKNDEIPYLEKTADGSDINLNGEMGEDYTNIHFQKIGYEHE